MSLSEFEIIRTYFAESGLAFPRAGVELGIGDDAALLSVPQDRLLCMTMDLLAEGVHFPAGADPAGVASRALGVNLSDLAAMGAEPFCFTLALALPHADQHWLQGFSAGLLELARRFEIPLVGGDTTEGPLTICIQAQGLVPRDGAIRRDGARPGDRIYVSGTLGDGAIALASMGIAGHLGPEFQLQADFDRVRHGPLLEQAYYRPEPRLPLALACADLVSAGIDISDGLHGDLGHIIDASGVGASLQLARLPYSEAARAAMNESNRLRAALFGGDDYELCLTVNPSRADEFERRAAAAATPVTCVGVITEGRGIRCLDSADNEVAIADHAYTHFL